jgi:hypothetical protein
MEKDFKSKYLKYKMKYQKLKLSQLGGGDKKGKPKVAFLFLTIGDINYSNLWEKYFRGHEDKCNIYCHPKNPNNVKSFFKNKIIKDRVETKWGHISIVEAMTKLLRKAFNDDKKNEYFIFRSESCVPIKSFSKMYDFVTKYKNKSLFALVNNMGQHQSRFKYLKNNEKVGLTLDKFYKGETWSIISRKHVITILKEFPKMKEVFKDVYVPEEHFNVSIILLKHSRKSIKDISTTLVHWISGKHPYSFGPMLSKKDKNVLIEKNTDNTFFARKFNYDKNNNVEKFIEKLIK